MKWQVRMKKKNGTKTSKFYIPLKFQIAFSFLSLLIMVIVVCIFMNSFFLERYYLRNKQEVLESSYNVINDAFNEDKFDSEEMNIELQRICATYNISVIIMDESTDTVMSSMERSEIMTKQLFEHLFNSDDDDTQGNGGPKNEILEKGDNYTLQMQIDMYTKDQYLEMWGTLDNGNLFLIRSSIDSVSDNIAISNRFLIYTGIVVAVIFVFLSLYASKKLSSPIIELTAISEQMKDLNFEAKYNGHQNNEIGILGKNFNELSETLEKTISELKAANNELENDLERRNKIDDMRKEFVSNVSHELKTPLALIQGYAEGLKDCVNDDAESRDFYCDVIIDEASKMNNMVRKLLDLNQLEFGNDAPVFERFDVAAMVKSIIQSSDILLKQSDARVHIEDYEPIYVWGDEYKAEEVFTNYLSNAINHLDGERKIDIAIRQMEKSVRISVFNSGIPIPEDSLPYIWDKFYKVDKARTREYGGSGVGLSIVKAIQEAINQEYGVTNYNNGVEFYFDLDRSAE